MNMLSRAFGLLAGAIIIVLGSYPVSAQTIVVDSCAGAGAIWAAGQAGRAIIIDTTGTQCVSAAVSASITGFEPGASYATLTATGSSADAALPTGAVVAAFNTGTTAVSCSLSVGAGTAVAGRNIIQPGSWFAFTVGSNTHAACINEAGDSASNVVRFSGGTGLPTGAGGGGSSGGAVTIANGADVTLGAVADAAWSSGNGTVISLLKNLAGGIAGPIPTQAPTVSVGGVGIIDSAGTNVASVKAASTAPAATDKSVVVALNPNAGTPAKISEYPFGATPYTATATGTTGATTATLGGAASVTTYICGFSIRANATAAATGNATVTGVITATLNFTQWTAPNASGLGITEMIFQPCIPASATNTSIAVVSAAPGTGGVVSVTAWGFKL